MKRYIVSNAFHGHVRSNRVYDPTDVILLSRRKHEPLKARLYLSLGMERSVDKFASFKLIDPVGSSIIILEEFESTLMEIIE